MQPPNEVTWSHLIAGHNSLAEQFASLNGGVDLFEGALIITLNLDAEDWGEAISYAVPAASGAAPPVGLAPGRLTNYVFAHSKYSSGLAQRVVMADMLIESDQQQPAIEEAAAHVAP